MTPFEDLTLLRAFVGIVEAGSISRGARTLTVPQPTLSRYLRVLEERSGTALLRRDTHRMSLTEAGHRLLADARALLALAEDSLQRLHDEQSALRGHLRLFATIDFGQFTVTRLIARFLQAYPDLTVELAYSNRPLHMIQDGYDAGIVVGDLTDESVVARPAGKVIRYLVAGPKLAGGRPAVKGPDDLIRWPWVSLSGAQFGGAEKVVLSTSKRASQTIRISPVMTAEGVTSLREAVRAGVGVAVLPDWLVREDLDSGRLIRLLPAWNAKEFPVHVIYQGQQRLSVRVRTFVDYAVSYMTTEIHTAV